MAASKRAYPPFHPSSRAPLPLSMSLAEFRAAYPRETSFVEFKSGVSTRAIQEAVVAFSNGAGGIVLIGVADDAEVLGRELTQNVEETIHHAISETRNPGQYGLHRIAVGEAPVIVLSVAPRVEGFAQTSNGRVLVRRGPMNAPLFDADLLRFVRERALDRFELQELALGMEAVTPELVKSVRSVSGWADEPDEIVERLGEQHLLSPSGKLTVAGALYLLKDPAKVLGKAYIEILRYPTEATPDYDRRLEVRGPLPHQIREATSFILEELGTELVVIGTQRHDLRRLPEVVVREALANAVGHRQYEASRTAVRVEMRPGIVTVVSPGPLPTPVTVENIRDAQAPRNVAVIRLLRRFRLAEDAGRGVDVMQDSMRAELLEPPTFADTGHSVRVTLPVRSTVTARERAWVRELERRGDLEPTDRILLVQAARGDLLTNRQVRDLTGLDRVEATRALQRLCRTGFLVQYGTRGGATYQLAGDLSPPAGLRLSAAELRAVVLEMAADGPVTNARVRDRLGVDRAEALRLLDAAVRDGQLVRIGERRGARYVIAE